ncbi:MAG: NAD(P)/FAD-dependent oxidoreductase [bacterium]|nr:NAD(P)/FAD-dependent oxidoreductase [bacterium]
MIYDIVVVGGGPAGMMAAGRAGELGARVLLVEKNQQLGAKLLATGHGRCNFTNLQADKKETIGVYGKNFKFLFSAFSKFGVASSINFFSKFGVESKEEDRGRVFPLSDKAGDIREALVKYLKKNSVEVRLGAEVKEIVAKDKKIEKIILTNGEEILGRNFIISTGGKSYPETGSTGSAYGWLESLGHKIIAPRPALTPIVVKPPHQVWCGGKEKIVKKLEGLSLENIGISVYQNDKKIMSRTGEIIFTADGLSGPAIIDLSGHVGEFLLEPTFLKIDFKPEIEISKFEEKLQKDFHQSHNKMLKNYLAGLVQPKLLPAIIELSGVNEQKQVSDITKVERQALARALKEFTLEAKELKGFNKAMVTAGGVDIKEVDSRTMRSKIYENLFLAGEILDLDGPTGGYNLQICWSTGFVAGESVTF